MSGRIPASSHASSALSTASFTHVSKALRGLSKPRRWRFLVKNSDTEMSRWRAPISTAETVGTGFVTGGFGGVATGFGGVAAGGLAAGLGGLVRAFVFKGTSPYKQTRTARPEL